MRQQRLIDSHCHVHSVDYPLDKEEVLGRAREEGVDMVCVGTSLADSKVAVKFAAEHDGVWAVVGVHPHGESDSDKSLVMMEQVEEIRELFAAPKVVAIGEIGLDYHYQPCNKNAQIRLLERQLQMARETGLPVVFHVREAFEDFWAVLRGFSGIRGVLHSYTDDLENLKRGVDMGLYIGVNGIATFTKEKKQLDAYRGAPLERILLETDAPYLTPKPFRGTMNEPANVSLVAKWFAEDRHLPQEEISEVATMNTKSLFNI